MHIVQLPQALLFAVNTLGIEAALPDTIARVAVNAVRQAQPVQHLTAPCRKTHPSQRSNRGRGLWTSTAARSRFHSKAPRSAVGSAGPALRTLRSAQDKLCGPGVPSRTSLRNHRYGQNVRYEPGGLFEENELSRNSQSPALVWVSHSRINLAMVWSADFVHFEVCGFSHRES